jgi:LysM repeat protein
MGQKHPGRTARGLIVAVVLALVLGGAAWRPARAEGVVHTVAPGENLYRIGLKYGVTWMAIMEANHLGSSTIYSGQQLTIPVAGSPPADPPPADNPPAPPPPAPTTGTTHTVQRGEYLSMIAQRYGVTTAAIAAANNLSNPSLIYSGQVLVIPGSDGSLPAPGPAPVPGGAGQRILVDISEQRMYVYQDGALQWNFIVSTGSPGLDTRPGNYSVLNKIPNAYGATWNIWMPNWLGIYWAGYLQNGIHALPILSNGGRLWDGYLGTRVSFGCVILGIADAQTLYDWAQVGAPVDIQY